MPSRAGVTLTLALALPLAALAVQYKRTALPNVRYDRFDLPAFDPYAYMAMAEHPTVFTVAPWGYRLLTPALARLLPVGNVARGFRVVTLAALLAAAGLLFWLLRRLGCGQWGAAAGALLLALSGPVAEALELRMLAEPVTLALEVAFLALLLGGAGAASLALVAALGALAKEFFVLLLPLVFLVRRRGQGALPAARLTLVVAGPALLATVLLRAWWTPYLHPELPSARLALQRLADTWGDWAASTLLGGLTPLALLGALREKARDLRLPALYMALATLAPPFFNPVAFFAADIPRLLVYLLPLAIPLALLAVDRVLPLWPGPAAAPLVLSRPATLACTAVAVLLGLSPLALDTYRRLDLRGARDGPLVLAVARETLRTAGRLQRGQPVAFSPESHRFAWGDSDPGRLRNMRWFLREGWGPLPHYGTRDMVAAEARATLLVPCLHPRDLEAELTLDAPLPTTLAFSLNGAPVGEARPGPQAETVRLRLPAGRFFRGDNLLALQREEGGGPVRLQRLELRPAP